MMTRSQTSAEKRRILPLHTALLCMALAVLAILGTSGNAHANNTIYYVNNQPGSKRGISGLINQAGPVFHLMFTTEEKVEDFASFNKRDAARYARFAELLLEEGVLVRPSGLWYVSAVHGDPEIESTLLSVDRTLAGLQR